MPAKTLAQRINIRASAKNIPLSVVVELTYRCNLRCYFCYQAHHCKSAKKEMSAAEWAAVFVQLAKAGTLYCTLTGGEPFVRGDILDIVAAVRASGCAVSMITNGTLITAAIARRLAKLSIMDIGVSLHATDCILHDRLTGKAGSFARALNAIRLLTSAGIKVMVKHTVSSANFGQYRPIRDLADTMGSLFECDTFVVPDGTKRVSPYALTGPQHTQFIRDMNAGVGSKGNAATLHCDAGRSVAGITPYGDVLPCIQLPIPLGSLRKAALASIWEGTDAFAFRKKEKRLLAECEQCDKQNYCGRCHGLAYFESGDFRGKSRSCCLRAKTMKELSLRGRPS